MTNVLQPSKKLLFKTYVDTFLAPLYWPKEYWQTRRENQAFEAGIESAWNYCARVWDRPFVDAWCELIHTPIRPKAPYASELLARFSMTFRQHQDFILAKASLENPVLAAYAIRMLNDPNSLPDAIRRRGDTIRLRDWYHETEMPLHDWIARLIRRHERDQDLR